MHSPENAFDFASGQTAWASASVPLPTVGAYQTPVPNDLPFKAMRQCINSRFVIKRRHLTEEVGGIVNQPQPVPADQLLS
jgi:hypothetical protein